MKDQFMEASGYTSSEVLAWNPVTSLFYTKNGGLYKLRPDGTIEDIKGPPSDPEERIDEDG